MIGTFVMRIILFLLVASAAQPGTAHAMIAEHAGFALDMIDEFAIACGVLAALFLIDKASWSVMTGGRHKR